MDCNGILSILLIDTDMYLFGLKKFRWGTVELQVHACKISSINGAFFVARYPKVYIVPQNLRYIKWMTYLAISITIKQPQHICKHPYWT